MVLNLFTNMAGLTLKPAVFTKAWARLTGRVAENIGRMAAQTVTDDPFDHTPVAILIKQPYDNEERKARAMTTSIRPITSCVVSNWNGVEKLAKI
jgi:uncharacterized protein YbjT (DUF2867 family)